VEDSVEDSVAVERMRSSVQVLAGLVALVGACAGGSVPCKTLVKTAGCDASWVCVHSTPQHAARPLSLRRCAASFRSL
jgi:hypothetical protein